ncbi:hypothetical protein V8F33_002919 [Rhypophila sp. PSN 637]
MRLPFRSVAFGITLIQFVTALDPANCNTAEKSRTGSDFQLTEQTDNQYLASLAKIFSDAGKVVKVADVFNDANHKLSTNSQGWKVWPTDFNDQGTEKWTPQGITSTADALDAGTYEGKDGWLVSWYQNTPLKSVRITFVDRSNDEYRHVMLVRPNAKDDFTTVPIHAGGILWYGNTLWVVDTDNGIRVFEMTNVWQVNTDGEGVGKMSAGGYSAATYKYVIPQIRWYKWTSPFPFRHSFMALDRTTTPDSLIIGEYTNGSEPTPPPIRFVRYELDYTTRKLKTDSNKVAKAVWAYCVNIDNMQGAVSADGKFYISTSNGKTKDGDMYGWAPGRGAYNNKGLLPRGPEDVSYDKRGGGWVYSVTEHPGYRYIWKTKASSVKFS